MAERTIYACDPEKNVACPKTACKYNPQSKLRDCFSTSHIEFAQVDSRGDPIVNDALTAFSNIFSENDYGDNHSHNTTPHI